MPKDFEKNRKYEKEDIIIKLYNEYLEDNQKTKREQNYSIAKTKKNQKAKRESNNLITKTKKNEKAKKEDKLPLSTNNQEKEDIISKLYNEYMQENKNPKINVYPAI